VVIENEILMLIRNNKKTKGEVYLSDPIGVDKEGNEYHLTCYTMFNLNFGKQLDFKIIISLWFYFFILNFK